MQAQARDVERARLHTLPADQPRVDEYVRNPKMPVRILQQQGQRLPRTQHPRNRYFDKTICDEGKRENRRINRCRERSQQQQDARRSHSVTQVQARSRYVPSEVLTRMRSPSLMNGGTCTISPVSIFAGLVTFETVEPFRPGSVSTTVKSTLAGNSTLIGLPS